MMPMEYHAHPVCRVLNYLKRMEMRAHETHNRWAALHYSLVHAFVFDHVYGVIPTPWEREIAIPRIDVPVKPRVTRSREEMLARPLRRVVHRVDSVVPCGAAGIKTAVVVEVLECGHRTQERPTFFNEKPARHRRCADCATLASAASAKLARRAHA